GNSLVQMDIGRLSGGLGRYQLMLLAMVFLRSFPSSWTLTGLEFIAGDVDHWCAPPDHNWTPERWRIDGVPTGARCHQFAVDPNGSINRSIIESCNRWAFNTTSVSSSVVEFNLVCERSWQKSAIQSVVFVAQIVGALLTGKLSDR
ncbi:organic cation transporter protein-like, partial [Tropilaelaps mercedesae]